MPPVFQGLTFWLLVSFVLIIVSLPVFVRICLYLSATPFQCMIWLLVIFSVVDYCIKCGSVYYQEKKRVVHMEYISLYNHSIPSIAGEEKSES